MLNKKIVQHFKCKFVKSCLTVQEDSRIFSTTWLTLPWIECGLVGWEAVTFLLYRTLNLVLLLYWSWNIQYLKIEKKNQKNLNHLEDLTEDWTSANNSKYFTTIILAMGHISNLRKNQQEPTKFRKPYWSLNLG